jgi:hypothetical protein
MPPEGALPTLPLFLTSRFLSPPRRRGGAAVAAAAVAAAAVPDHLTGHVGPEGAAARRVPAGGGFGAERYATERQHSDGRRRRPHQHQPAERSEQQLLPPPSAPASPQRPGRPRGTSIPGPPHVFGCSGIGSPGGNGNGGRATALVEAAVSLEADLAEAREGAEALEARLRLAEDRIQSRVGWVGDGGWVGRTLFGACHD